MNIKYQLFNNRALERKKRATSVPLLMEHRMLQAPLKRKKKIGIGNLFKDQFLRDTEYQKSHTMSNTETSITLGRWTAARDLWLQNVVRVNFGVTIFFFKKKEKTKTVSRYLECITLLERLAHQTCVVNFQVSCKVAASPVQCRISWPVYTPPSWAGGAVTGIDSSSD